MSTCYAGIEFSGADAQTFLQAQLATDLRELADNQWRWSAVCSLKGRVIGTGPLLRADQQRWLWLLSGDLAESLHAHLSRYLLRSKLHIDLHKSVTLIAEPLAEGEEADQQLQQKDEKNGHGWRARNLPSGWNLSLSLDQSGQTQAAQTLQDWENARLALGLAMLSSASSDQHLSHSLLLHQLHAVSLSKGCYPGQEIIARTHYLGKNKRTLILIEAALGVNDGDNIVSDERTVGHVVESVPGGHALGATMQDALDGRQLQINGVPVQWRPTAIA